MNTICSMDKHYSLCSAGDKKLKLSILGDCLNGKVK